MMGGEGGGGKGKGRVGGGAEERKLNELGGCSKKA